MARHIGKAQPESTCTEADLAIRRAVKCFVPLSIASIRGRISNGSKLARIPVGTAPFAGNCAVLHRRSAMQRHELKRALQNGAAHPGTRLMGPGSISQERAIVFSGSREPEPASGGTRLRLTKLLEDRWLSVEREDQNEIHI